MVPTIKDLAEAEISLCQRKFTDSLDLANSALEKALESDGIESKARILLLMSRIFNTQGRYNYDCDFHDKSLAYLNAALRFFPEKKGFYWDIQIEKGLTYLHKEYFGDAIAIFEECQNSIEEIENIPCTQAKFLLALSELHYQKNEYDESIDNASKTLEIAGENELGDKLYLEIYSQLVKVYLRRHEYTKVLEYGNLTLELSKKLEDKEKEYIGLNAIGVYNASQNDFKTAMFNFMNGYDISSKINFKYGVAHSLINIGTIYAKLFNYNEALERYNIVLDNYENVIDDSTVLTIMNNAGNIYFVVGDLEKAMDYFERALSMAREMNYTKMLVHTLSQISGTLLAQGKYREALKYAFESEEIIEKTSNLEGKQTNYITLGNIYYKLGDFDLAMKYIGKGIIGSKQIKDTANEIKGYRIMSNIFQEKGDYKKALEYQLIYSQAQENYAIDQRNRQIIDIEIQYDIQKKEQEIKLLTKFQNELIRKNNKIAEQNEQLKVANENLKQFTYVVSHDLNEPLRMIGSYSNMIQKRYADQLDESSEEFFAYVNTGVTRMSKLLKDLLKYTTVGENMEWRETVNLNDVLDGTLLNFALKISESNALIKKQDLPTIVSSESLVSQLFQNLIGNALKFNKPGTPPEISISCEQEEGKYLISFRDRGIGIPQDELDRIFVIFQRLHKRSDYQGTGIGLSICMKIIKKLKGTLSVQSEEGQGSIFTVGLPINPTMI